MPKWNEISPAEREKYVNQDYVPRKYILLNPDIFDAKYNIASLYDEFHINEYDVQNLLSILTKKQKEAITLYFLEGKTQKEIAEKLGISQQAVFFRIRCARRKLEKMYKNVLVTYVK